MAPMSAILANIFYFVNSFGKKQNIFGFCKFIWII